MKRASTLFLTMMLVLALIVPAMAEEKATKDECVAKAKEAAKLIQDSGMEAGLAKINDKAGPFVWKDSYVFAINTDNKQVVAHPVQPNLVGKNLVAIKDVNGKMFFAEFINVGLEKGEGWVSYMWPKPNEKDPSPKVTYVLKVPGQPVVVAAGIYE